MDFHLFNTSETFSRLVTLIREAKECVTLISPYVTLATDDQVGRAIREALSRKVKVALVFRRDEHTSLKEDWLESMRPHVDAGLALRYVEGLHAKIYKSESTVLVTSLNRTRSSNARFSPMLSNFPFRVRRRSLPRQKGGLAPAHRAFARRRATASAAGMALR